jgi:hypothetical protein
LIGEDHALELGGNVGVLRTKDNRIRRVCGTGRTSSSS